MARLPAGHEGRIHDVSAGGVRLEHEGTLRPGEPCLLGFGLNDELFTFSGRVVWSRAMGRVDAGSGRLLFQSGVAFEQIPDAAKRAFAKLLTSDRFRVLVVDDEPSVRSCLRAALPAASYEIHEAVEGREALEKAERLVPDLIVLDVRLPGIDGFEVCRALKEHPATRRVPVIFVTAVEDTRLHRRMQEAGGTACLTKPFRLESLIALTHAVIENARR